jgi:hypothetical protein
MKTVLFNQPGVNLFCKGGDLTLQLKLYNPPDYFDIPYHEPNGMWHWTHKSGEFTRVHPPIAIGEEFAIEHFAKTFLVSRIRCDNDNFGRVWHWEFTIKPVAS